MANLYTIGYEGASLADFLRRLTQAGVAILVDVRELPLSRRKGFSKTSLSAALNARGIHYVHCRELGAPKAIRHELRETSDYQTYFRRFDAYLRTQVPAVQWLAEACTGRNVVLMCFEADPAECHRSAVAREVGKLRNQDPIHLRVRGGPRHGQLPETTRMRAGQGIPAA